MPGLGRDVLRWLVSLNLSFPIKNIKRDFSNGFMVAEIFSRYFPLDIHMHSYDYGSRAASKKDNWEQLNKFFRKKGFVVLNHEVDNIIHCRTEEGAGPLLERMYNFLTQTRMTWAYDACGVRYKPGLPAEGETELSLAGQQNAIGCAWKPQIPSMATPRVNCGREQDQFSGSPGTSNSSENNGDYSEQEMCGEMCTSKLRDHTTASSMDIYHNTSPTHRDHHDKLGMDSYNGVMKLDTQYERQCLIKLDDQEYSLEFKSPSSEESHHTGRFVHTVEDRREKSGDLHQVSFKTKPGTNGFNAVEKARQREVRNAKGRAKAGVRGEKLAELAQKARVEAGLAFRSPNRKRNFKQYTLPDYRRQKQFGYVELGRLGPGDPTPELVVQREKLTRIKEFGRHARSCNIMSHSNPTLVDYSKTVKVDHASARKKALAFASTIPKPKVRVPRKESHENLLPLQNPHPLTELQILEAKHQSDKQHVEAIRRDLELFLR